MGNDKFRHINPDFLKPELSTKLYMTTYNFLSRFYSEAIFLEVCRELEMPFEYLLQRDNWVSVKFGARFARRITEKTGDPEVYRKIGAFAFSPENLSPLEYSIMKSLSPYMMLKSAQQLFRRWNTVCTVKLKKVGFGKYCYQLTSDAPIYKEMALNTLGVVEAYQKLFALELFKADLEIDNLENPKSFSLTMSFSAFSFYARRTFLLTVLLSAGYGFGYFLTHAEEFLSFDFLPILSGLIYIILLFTYKLAENLKVFRASSDDYHNQVREKNVNLYEKSQLLERRYQEARLLKDLSAELIGCREPNAVIAKCLNSIQEKFGYPKAAVFLISAERKKMYLANSIGFEGLPLDQSKVEFVFPNPDKQEGFIATVVERGETKLILDIETYKSILKPQNKFILDALKVGSLIISPIQSGNKKFGAFLLLRGRDEQQLDRQDQFLVENISSQLSLYFESAMNFENEVRLRTIFQKYVPRTVLEQINLQTDKGGYLSPQRQNICSVFMDLRGFTKACDGAAPERAFALINEFADFTSKNLAEHGAIIDNIIGDEIVSFFISKNDDDNICLRALSAISSIRSGFSKLSARLQDNGFGDIRVGIGIHFGEASIGSVGGDAKMNYTALGSTVNIASRLQALSKKHEVSEVTVLVSTEVAHRVFSNSDIQSRVKTEVLRGTSTTTNFLVLEDSDFEKLNLSVSPIKSTPAAAGPKVA